jgi:hypothetical protein
MAFGHLGVKQNTISLLIEDVMEDKCCIDSEAPSLVVRTSKRKSDHIN